MEISGSFNPLVFDGGAHLAVAIRDWAALEAGVNLALLDPRWGLGFVGTRFSYGARHDRSAHFIADLELGVGAGVGGELHGNDPPSDDCPRPECDGVRSLRRFAAGGYQGFAIGGRVAWFSIYGRVHFDESGAYHIPATLWSSAALGLEAQIGRHVAIGVSGGYVGYLNDVDRVDFGFFQASATVFLDAFKRHVPRPQRPPTRWPPPSPLPRREPGQEWNDPFSPR